MTTDNTSETFRSLGVAAGIADALEAAGIVNPFPIQALTLPVALSGNDIIGQARTGTGKTLAFGVPMLQRTVLDACRRDHRPAALLVVPTGGLCVQGARAPTHPGRRVTWASRGRPTSHTQAGCSAPRSSRSTAAVRTNRKSRH